MIFENKLKPGTTPAIQALRQAHLACRMITGDNPLTAVSVARECGLINTAAHVFAPTFIRGMASCTSYSLYHTDSIVGNALTPMAKIEWSCMDEENWTLDDYSLKPLQPPSHSTVDGDAADHHDYTLVVTGDVFRWMITHAPLETLQRVSTEIGLRL